MKKYVVTSYEFVYCACGCGKTRSKYKIINGYEKKTVLRTFIKGHENIGRILADETKQKIRRNNKGKKRSLESRKRISESHRGVRMGELNNMWKGDLVGYAGLHRWMRKYLPKPESCHMCKQKAPKEVACLTGIYNRDFKNWAWFCARCHKYFDNIIERNLKPYIESKRRKQKE